MARQVLDQSATVGRIPYRASHIRDDQAAYVSIWRLRRKRLLFLCQVRVEDELRAVNTKCRALRAPHSTLFNGL